MSPRYVIVNADDFGQSPSVNAPEEALEGIREIDDRYEHHCHAARVIAAGYFDAAKVLPRLIAGR